MKYRKKPIVIDAVQWDGKNFNEISDFAGICADFNYDTQEGCFQLIVHTLEGNMKASIGDYIICGVNGEFYPCKPEIFEKTYEIVKDVKVISQKEFMDEFDTQNHQVCDKKKEEKHIYHVHCDRCGLDGYILAENEEYAKMRFEKWGWRKIGDKNYCKECAKNKKLKDMKFETEFYIKIGDGELQKMNGVKHVSSISDLFDL